MQKHLCLKAFVLLVVMFFHSFVLVPRAFATVWEGNVARVMFRAVAPVVVSSTPVGWGYAIGYFALAGAAYMFVKSGGVTALKNWWNSAVGAYSLPSDNEDSWFKSNGAITHYHVYMHPSNSLFYYLGGSGTDKNDWTPGTPTGWCAHPVGGATGGYASFATAYAACIGGSAPSNPPPAIPTDYVTQLAVTQPSIPANTVFVTPGGASAINGSNPIGTVTSMSDADIDKMVAALGATAVDSAGVQPRPNTGDNTLSADANASIPYLQQIMNYVSNLLGIKTDTGSIKTNTDNLVVGQSVQTSAVNQSLGKLDNIAVLMQASKNTMDNVGIAINNQTAIQQQLLGKMDNVDVDIKDLSKVAATQSTISARIDGLKSLMATKFPFSFISGITAPSGGGGGHYDIPDLQFTGGYTLVVDPMKYPVFADFFGTVRTLVSIGMWAVFTLVMIRRVTQI